MRTSNSTFAWDVCFDFIYQSECSICIYLTLMRYMLQPSYPFCSSRLNNIISADITKQLALKQKKIICCRLQINVLKTREKRGMCRPHAFHAICRTSYVVHKLLLPKCKYAMYESVRRIRKKRNSVALSPRANYTDWSTATCRRNLVSTFVDRGVSRGQRGGSPTVVNLSFLGRSR
jgi:hypothetical protein